jgi:hypothetical protein
VDKNDAVESPSPSDKEERDTVRCSVDLEEPPLAIAGRGNGTRFGGVGSQLRTISWALWLGEVSLVKRRYASVIYTTFQLRTKSKVRGGTYLNKFSGCLSLVSTMTVGMP